MRRPDFIAVQSRHPQGLLGQVVASIMAMETRGDNLWAIETLAPRPGQRILDIGTGHGAALADLAARVGGGKVVGIDPSEVMVRMAKRRNLAGVDRGTIEVMAASAENLPIEDCSFDGAMAVHVLYFWPDLARPFAEIARVLKPGGRLVLLFRVKDDPATAVFPETVYRFRSVDEVLGGLSDAGLETERVEGHLQGSRPTPAILSVRRAR